MGDAVASAKRLYYVKKKNLLSPHRLDRDLRRVNLKVQTVRSCISTSHTFLEEHQRLKLFSSLLLNTYTYKYIKYRIFFVVL